MAHAQYATCIEACNACADACDHCAAACKRCAEECRRMAGAKATKPSTLTGKHAH